MKDEVVADLRAAVIMDYQNVHLTARDLFGDGKQRPPHEFLVDPLHFGNQLISTRNAAQRPGMDHAVLSRILVYRGLPSPEHDPKPYARNQAQHAHWERDSRVAVHSRPLKYAYERDEDGHPRLDANGRRIVTGKSEKGIDVLCALALVREARRPDIDLVVLASRDSDLAPALDEALLLDVAKVETVTWFDHAQRYRCGPVTPTNGLTLWNTRLRETEFRNCQDLTKYS